MCPCSLSCRPEVTDSIPSTADMFIWSIVLFIITVMLWELYLVCFIPFHWLNDSEYSWYLQLEWCALWPLTLSGARSAHSCKLYLHHEYLQQCKRETVGGGEWKTTTHKFHNTGCVGGRLQLSWLFVWPDPSGTPMFEKTLQKCPLGCPSSGENAVQFHIPHRIQLVPFWFFSPLLLNQPESTTGLNH